MSLATPRGKGEGVMQQTIQKVLEKNHHLAQRTLDDLSKGKAAECTQRQEILHGSPAYLATVWDSSQNTQSPLLPSQSEQDAGTLRSVPKWLCPGAALPRAASLILWAWPSSAAVQAACPCSRLKRARCPPPPP